MAKKQSSAAAKSQYANYKGRYEMNRLRRLEKHLKRQPNDEKAQEATKNINYRRKKPMAQGGWVAKGIRESDLFKGVTGRKRLKFCGWVKAQMNRGEALGRVESYQKKKADGKKKAA